MQLDQYIYTINVHTSVGSLWIFITVIFSALQSTCSFAEVSQFQCSDMPISRHQCSQIGVSK